MMNGSLHSTFIVIKLFEVPHSLNLLLPKSPLARIGSLMPMPMTQTAGFEYQRTERGHVEQYQDTSVSFRI